MTYQFLNQDQTIVGRKDDDGLMRVTGDAATWPEYLDWLNAGNTPEAAPPPIPPGPDYLAFWDALLVSNVYQSIRAQALVNPGVLVSVTESIAAITDAKAGRPNVPAIQASLDNLLASGNFTVEELTELYDLFVVANLQGVFTLNVSQSPTP